MPLHPSIRHVLTLSFDDGFQKSSLRTAEIHERHGLSACINVLANPDPAAFGGRSDDFGRLPPKGDFPLWNELAARGHEIMPHGWNHAHKPSMPPLAARESIERCLEAFSRRMHGFSAERAVFNFPYNASTPDLGRWLPTRVRAFRDGMDAGDPINPLPQRSTVRIGTVAFGPGNSEAHCDAMIDRLLARASGWLVYNLHGLEDEGWGPVRGSWLDERLASLVRIPGLAILPAAAVFAEVDAPE